jgi:FAD dependent oxidoreductase TIGR03364
MEQKKAIVVGAGIVGLAAARALALKGYQVDVFEKTEFAVGASIRNFGMVWPIGQPDGYLFERACRTKDIWQELCDDANLWHSKKGSLHLAYEKDELDTIEEFVDLTAGYRNVRLVNKDEVLSMSDVANPDGLLGGFFSTHELIVDSRQAISALPTYFTEKLGVVFHFLTPVTAVDHPYIWCGTKKHAADEIYICSGVDFEHLYHDLYLASPLTRCKLQMMRTAPQEIGLNIGPALCGGLTLLHNTAFRECTSIGRLLARVQDELPEYLEYGIHVLISQNGRGEVTIGDSHEYGFTHDPFIRNNINSLIINYLRKFVVLPNLSIQQAWNGFYVKMIEGTELVLSPQEGVTIVNGLGGAGMTLSFGLLEEVVSGRYRP